MAGDDRAFPESNIGAVQKCLITKELLENISKNLSVGTLVK